MVSGKRQEEGSLVSGGKKEAPCSFSLEQGASHWLRAMPCMSGWGEGLVRLNSPFNRVSNPWGGQDSGNTQVFLYRKSITESVIW